jgi:hypothetical protein
VLTEYVEYNERVTCLKTNQTRSPQHNLFQLELGLLQLYASAITLCGKENLEC